MSIPEMGLLILHLHNRPQGDGHSDGEIVTKEREKEMLSEPGPLFIGLSQVENSGFLLRI